MQASQATGGAAVTARNAKAPPKAIETDRTKAKR
jgi:hypothetical protein